MNARVSALAGASNDGFSQVAHPSEMAVGDNFTPECRSAYVRRALAVSIVTYRGSKPRSIVVEALRQRSRQVNGRSCGFRKGVDLAKEADKGRD